MEIETTCLKVLDVWWCFEAELLRLKMLLIYFVEWRAGSRGRIKREVNACQNKPRSWAP